MQLCTETTYTYALGPTCYLPVVHAVVPMKRLAQAKSRLASGLNAVERRALALRMFEHVARTLLDCSWQEAACGPALPAASCQLRAPIAEVWVVSADSEVLALAEALGARTLFDQAEGLNGALEQARIAARAAGGGALLVLPGDLPLLTADDVAAMVRALADGADLVLAPDGAGEGTNALGLMIDAPLAFQFEGRSFARHLAAAAWHELLFEVIHSRTLALDVDTIDGLERFQHAQQPLSPHS